MLMDQSIVKMRRFLRDPAGLIWSDDDLVAYFNEGLLEIFQKCQLNEKIEAHRYPPTYNWAYMWDWEYQYTDGDQYQALSIDQLVGWTICFPWEPAYWMDDCPTSDDGYRFTMPFEACCCDQPAEPVEMELDLAFTRMRFAAFDKWPIMAITRREIIDQDRFFRTRVGSRVLWYYRPDEYSYKMILYPAPAGVIWQDDVITPGLSDTEGLADPSLLLRSSDLGITTETINLDSALFVVYDAVPYAIESVSDEIPCPDWIVRYVEYAALERAFGADTDGCIPSLKDLWQKRKEVGIKILQKMKRQRNSDQEYRLGGPPRIPHSKGGSLPAGYPPVWR